MSRAEWEAFAWADEWWVDLRSPAASVSADSPVATLRHRSRHAILAAIRVSVTMIEELDQADGRGDALPALGSEVARLQEVIFDLACELQGRLREAEREARRAAVRLRTCLDEEDRPGRCTYRFDLEFGDGLNDGPRCGLPVGHEPLEFHTVTMPAEELPELAGLLTTAVAEADADRECMKTCLSDTCHHVGCTWRHLGGG